MFDLFLVAGRVVGTKVLGAARSVVSKLSLLVDETADDEPLYFGPIVWRPDPERSAANATPTLRQGAAEVWAVRTGDSVVPLAGRDLRQNAECNPADGSTVIPHYGGTTIDVRWNADRTGSLLTVYAPRKNGAGVAVAAHSVTIDTAETTSSVVVQHASGSTIALDKDGNILLAVGATLFQVKSDGIVINGNVNVTGAIVQGASDPSSPAVDFVALATKTIQELLEIRAWALAHVHAALGAAALPTVPPLAPTVAAIGALQTKGA